MHGKSLHAAGILLMRASLPLLEIVSRNILINLFNTSFDNRAGKSHVALENQSRFLCSNLRTEFKHNSDRALHTDMQKAGKII